MASAQQTTHKYSRKNCVKVQDGWKELAEAMPGGQSQPCNARTIDVFPTWDALGKGTQVRAMWVKGHPTMDYTSHMEKLNAPAEPPRVDVYKVVERITK